MNKKKTILYWLNTLELYMYIESLPQETFIEMTRCYWEDVYGFIFRDVFFRVTSNNAW